MPSQILTVHGQNVRAPCWNDNIPSTLFLISFQALFIIDFWDGWVLRLVLAMLRPGNGVRAPGQVHEGILLASSTTGNWNWNISPHCCWKGDKWTLQEPGHQSWFYFKKLWWQLAKTRGCWWQRRLYDHCRLGEVYWQVATGQQIALSHRQQRWIENMYTCRDWISLAFS